MTDLLIINEDPRRKLTAFPEGKLLEIKEDCIVGKHYHKIKTEWFVLVRGECRHIYWNIGGVKVVFDSSMFIGQIVIIQPMVYHEFYIKKGSILFGLCTHPYDPKDDYHL